MVSVTVSPASKVIPIARGLPVTLEVAGPNPRVADVKAALAAKYPKFYSSRQKLTLKGDKKALADEISLETAGITSGAELSVKDLGPQVSWTTVFVIEYIGPLILHPLFYHLPKIFYGGNVQHSRLQQFVYAMVMLHFVKRELETLFVHRFSHSTMPFNFIFRNSAHYHILGGLFLAFALYSPTYAATSPYIRGTIRDDPTFLWACTAFWTFCELSNLQTHLTLRSLRPAGSRERGIPHGYGFGLVSLPNYFFEILGWLTIVVMTGSWAAIGFIGTGAITMGLWAQKKHRNYKKEFGDKYPRSRKAMIPFLF